MQLIKAIRLFPALNRWTLCPVEVLKGGFIALFCKYRLSKECHRVIYDIHEYDVLKDSSNLNIADWVEMAEDVRRYYREYDGFVILHGTDTMAYTSSALSFMLENLGKPVILTGAQVPLPELRSDGRDNLLGAVYIAGHYVIPEVSPLVMQCTGYIINIICI